MAVYKKTLNGIEVKIHHVDHPPPHCHAFYKQKDLKINLHTLEIINPPPNELPSKLYKALKKELDELKDSWRRVKIIPPSGNPGDW